VLTPPAANNRACLLRCEAAADAVSDEQSVIIYRQLCSFQAWSAMHNFASGMLTATDGISSEIDPWDAGYTRS
jgi:hypothetical protein